MFYRLPVRRRLYMAFANVVTLAVIVTASVGGAILSARSSRGNR